MRRTVTQITLATRQLTKRGAPGPALRVKRIALMVEDVTADAQRQKVVERIYGTAGRHRLSMVRFELARQSAFLTTKLVTREAGHA